MKNLFLFLLLALFFAGSGVQAQPKAVITGKISKPLSDNISLITRVSPFFPDEVETEVLLNGNQFRIEVPVTDATIAELVHGNEVVPVYLEPGYELNLAFNGEKFLKSIKFEGKGASENNYLSQSMRRFSEIEEYQVLPDNIKLRENDFIEFLELRRKDQLKYLESFTAKNPVSAAFKGFALAEIDFGYAGDKLTYFDLREQMVRSEKRLTPSTAYFQFLEELDLQRPSNLLSPAFSNFLRNYTAYSTKAAGQQESNNTYYLTGYNLLKGKLTADIQTLALTQVLRQSLQKGHLKYSEEMLRDFKAINNKPEVAAYLDKLYNQHKDVAIGSPAPAFKFRDAAGEEVALSNYRGKLIYLSFWRSDCGLCTMEMPHLQEVAFKLSNSNIVFLNVNLDQDEATWRALVEKKNMQGVQLHADAPDPELVKRYGLKDVPAYFLIDAEGNLITAKPRRPNDREVEKDLLRHAEAIQASAR